MKVRCLLILLLMPAIAWAQQQYYGTTVSSVSLPQATDPADLQQIPLKNGDTITPENIRASIKALYDTQHYQQIEVDAVADPTGGTRLDFLTKPYFFFSTFLMDPATLLDRPISSFFRIPVGDKFSTDAVDRIIPDLIHLLEDRGYFDAMVTPEYVYAQNSPLVTVTLHVAVKDQARIGTVLITGQSAQDTFDTKEMAQALGLSEGDRFLAANVDKGITSLRGKFSALGFLNTRIDVKRAYDAVMDRVNLDINVEPGQFTLVEPRGFDISKNQLRMLVPIYEEGTVDVDLVEEGRVRIAGYMEQQGFFENMVVPEIIQAPLNDAIQINYNIVPGVRHTVHSVSFKGNTFFSNEQLIQRMKVQSAKFLNRGLFSEDLMAADIATIQQMYRNAGFDGTDVQGLHEDVDHSVVDVVIQIQEGIRSTIEQVVFAGNTAVPDGDLRTPISLDEGQNYTPVAVENARHTLMGVYYKKGFPDIQITTSVIPSDSHKVRITFQIVEGKQYAIGQILVEGNTKTSNKVITRTSRLLPNTPYNPEAILEAQQRLYATGLFTRVEIVPLNENLELIRNVLIQVEDAKAIQVTYGVGLKEFEGARGTIEISHNNLWGLNQSLGVRIRASSHYERFFQSTYGVPRLFNHELQGFALLTLEKTKRKTFDANRFDFSLQTIKQLSVPNSVRLTASYETVNLQDIRVNPQARRFPDVRGVVQIARVGSTFVSDHRDDGINPQHGTFTTTNFQVAARPLGSEVDFTSVFNQSILYRPFHSGVLAASSRIGWKRPFGDSRELPISERYFAGGSTTLRGFSLDEAGPPGGGQLMTIGNLEYRVPLPVVRVRGVGGALFYDVGNVFERAADFSLSDITHTLGLGLRYQTPLGPIRVDMGVNMFPKLKLQTDGTLQPEARIKVFFTLGNAF